MTNQNPADQATQSNDADQQHTDASYLANLVGDGKKYKTPEDLAKSKIHADEFIDTLKAELQQERDARIKAEAEAAKRQSAEEILKQLKEPTRLEEESKTPNLADVDIKELVKNVLKEQSAEERNKQNLTAFNTKLAELFGGERESKFKEKAVEVGLSPKFVAELAQQSPDAALKVLGLDGMKKPVAPSAPNGSASSASVRVQDPNSRRAYWDAMKKEKGLQWYLSGEAVALRTKDREAGLL